MRIINISVDGIHQAAHRGLFEWLSSQDAEIICIQDLRAKQHEIEDNPAFQLDGYFSYYLDSQKPHRNGVAIYTRQAPKAIMYGFGFASGEDTDGRYLQADFERLSVGSLLLPAIGDGTNQEDKMRFLTNLQSHLNKISNKRRRYIICGNWQLAHTDSDLENADNYAAQSGFLTQERQWLQQLFTDIGYLDAFRLANRDTDEYSWWPSGQIGNGDGWRTDFQVISKDLGKQVEYAVIYKAREFSSHAPVIVDYDLDRL